MRGGKSNARRRLGPTIAATKRDGLGQGGVGVRVQPVVTKAPGLILDQAHQAAGKASPRASGLSETQPNGSRSHHASRNTPCGGRNRSASGSGSGTTPAPPGTRPDNSRQDRPAPPGHPDRPRAVRSGPHSTSPPPDRSPPARPQHGAAPGPASAPPPHRSAGHIPPSPPPPPAAPHHRQPFGLQPTQRGAHQPGIQRKLGPNVSQIAPTPGNRQQHPRRPGRSPVPFPKYSGPAAFILAQIPWGSGGEPPAAAPGRQIKFS